MLICPLTLDSYSGSHSLYHMCFIFIQNLVSYERDEKTLNHCFDPVQMLSAYDFRVRVTLHWGHCEGKKDHSQPNLKEHSTIQETYMHLKQDLTDRFSIMKRSLRVKCDCYPLPSVLEKRVSSTDEVLETTLNVSCNLKREN